ncbi:hypothetical protein ACT7CX_29355 [Bacillus cereus]
MFVLENAVKGVQSRRGHIERKTRNKSQNRLFEKRDEFGENKVLVELGAEDIDDVKYYR